MKSLIALLGLLRLGLLALVVIDILLPAAWQIVLWFSGSEAEYSGWQAIPTLIAPVMAPILFVVLLFDIVMSSVHAADNPGEAGTRHRLIRRIELIFIGLLLLYWIPFFLLL